MLGNALECLATFAELFGIIAAVELSEMLKKRVLEAGFYVARIQDETFSLDTPDEFQAKCF